MLRLPYVLLALAAVTAGLAGCSQKQPRPTAAVKPASVPAPASAPSGATLDNPKIAPLLAATARKVRAAPDASAAKRLSTRLVHINDSGQIQVYVRVRHFGEQVKNRLEKAGATVERGSQTMGVYQAWASPTALKRLASLPGVTRITPPSYGFPKANR